MNRAISFCRSQRCKTYHLCVGDGEVPDSDGRVRLDLGRRLHDEGSVVVTAGVESPVLFARLEDRALCSTRSLNGSGGQAL